jgi:hypothetical protein
MFQDHEINRNKNKKINDRKVKNTMSLLTQFGDKHTYIWGLPSQEGNPLV